MLSVTFSGVYYLEHVLGYLPEWALLAEYAPRLRRDRLARTGRAAATERGTSGER